MGVPPQHQKMKKRTRSRIFAMLLVMCIACMSLSSCKKEEKKEEKTTGNTAGIADSELEYSDAQSAKDSGQAGALDGQKDINYIDQKAEGSTASQSGEQPAGEKTGHTPAEYHDAKDIPEGTYCVAHKNADGSTVYYPVYGMFGSYGTVPMAEGAASVQPERFGWTKIGYDDQAIPTMHAGDTLVYKSADAIPSYFNFERFSDEGYTIGVAGLVRADSGNYLFDLEKSYANDRSDTVGLRTLGAAQVYIVSVGNVRVSPTTVSDAGTVKGLTRNENYLCDVRTGTESITAAFRADSHLYVSLEQYKLATFYFSAKHTIEIAVEPTTPTGYYCINNSGFFRYIAEADEGKTLKAEDYNNPFITINTEGKLVATVDGYAISEDGFVVKER